MLLVCSKSTEHLAKNISYDKIMIISSLPTKDFVERFCDTKNDVIAIGGGAVLDSAKIICKDRITCIPTTASGSSATSWAVYWDGPTKNSIKRKIPKKVIIKQKIANKIFLPRNIMRNTIFDALSHCLDSLWSVKKTPLSEKYSKKALHLLTNNNDIFSVLKAGHWGGKAIEITGTNLLHALSYPLTGFYNIPHGLAIGYILARIVKYMEYNVIDIFNRFELGENIKIDFDFVINEALKYEKIFETTKIINKTILEEIFHE